MSRSRKFLIIAGIILGLGVLVPVIHHYQLRAATEAYIAELKAKGEPMDLAQVIPPPVPPEQNGMPLITNALAHLEGGIATTDTLFALQMIIPGKAIVGWQQSVILGSAGTNKWTWEELGEELAGIQNDLNSFQSLIGRPVLNFNLHYNQGWSMPIPHLRKLRRAAQWLSATTLCDLHQRNPSGACTNVRAMLAIIKGETDERTTVSQLVRVAIASMSADATWETLQYSDVSDSDLAQLQQDWDSLKFVTPSERALLWERVAALLTFNKTRGSDFRKMFLPVRGKWVETKWDLFWSYEDELRGLKAYQVVIDAARMAQTNNSFQPVQSFVHLNFVRLGLEKENGETQLTNFDLSLNEEVRVMFTGGGYASFAALRKIATMKTWQSIVVTAIALKRYELRYHHLPDSLDELVPDFLKSVPIDYMDGQPLRYHRNGDGTFLLYSVGEDGVDDGGDPRPPESSTSRYWLNGRDWVWPQPATAGEIQAYYNRQKSRK